MLAYSRTGRVSLPDLHSCCVTEETGEKVLGNCRNRRRSLRRTLKAMELGTNDQSYLNLSSKARSLSPNSGLLADYAQFTGVLAYGA